MSIDLQSQSAFDQYAAARNWFYDNGGTHNAQRWDHYVSDEYRWGVDDRVTDSLTILRQDASRVAAVHDHNLTRTEIWSGTVETAQDFEALLQFIDEYASTFR